MRTVTFMGMECEIHQSTYPRNKQPALELVAADTPGNREMGLFHGEPVVTATACLPDHPFQKGETAIKDYSENKGVLEILAKANLIEITGKTANSGFCSLSVVRLVV